MIIMSQDDMYSFVNMDNVFEIDIRESEDGLYVVATSVDGRSDHWLGLYDNENRCRDAIDKISKAYIEGQKIFKVPENE